MAIYRENKIAEELFKLIETEQGYSHISDGLNYYTNDRLFDVARNAREHHKKCAKILSRFLKKHGQP